MEIIRVRSPYFITVNETSQTSSKIELFIWHKGETEPATPTYTLSKNAPSTTQRANTYNISNYIKENIDIIAPTATNIVAEESAKMWAYCRVKRYATVSGVESLLNNVVYIGLNGYTDYSNGYNFNFPKNNLVLVNGKITRYYYLKTGYSDSSYFNYFMQETSPNDTIEVRYYDKSNTLIATTSLASDDDYLYKIPYTRNNVGLVNGGYVTIYNVTDADEIETIFSEPLCEPKYKPVVCSYINANGGWQYLTFFKAKSESFESKSKDYNLLPNAVDYNELRGQSKAFNFVATKSIKINTGWVDENYSLLIEELFNSETILLDNLPVKLKATSFELKTSLKDKMINYEIDFEYNYNQINNVI
jgi:hypothetical protein